MLCSEFPPEFIDRLLDVRSPPNKTEGQEKISERSFSAKIDFEI